jgi:hypothetical protein
MKIVNLVFFIYTLLIAHVISSQGNWIQMEDQCDKILISHYGKISKIKKSKFVSYSKEEKILKGQAQRELTILFPLKKQDLKEGYLFDFGFTAEFVDSNNVPFIEIGFKYDKNYSRYNELFNPTILENQSYENRTQYKYSCHILPKKQNPRYLYLKIKSSSSDKFSFHYTNLYLKEKKKNDSDLIFNGDFEYHYDCPTGYFPTISYLEGWNNQLLDYKILENNHLYITKNDISRSKILELGSPDQICMCNYQHIERFKHLEPYKGNCHTLIINGSTSSGIGEPSAEFLCTQLNEPLIMGQKYEVSFTFRFATPISKFEIYNLGLKLDSIPYTLSDEQIKDIRKTSLSSATYMVSDSIYKSSDNWKTVTYTFLASEKINYLTIGPFDNSDLETKRNKYNGISYIYIDEVKLKKVFN